MDLYGELAWRGLIHDATEGTRELLARESVTGYIGFDPTASSLHVGSLLPILALAHMQRAGHSPIALVGGGTGLIGDPSGKTAERMLLTPEQVQANVAGLRSQLGRFLDFDDARRPARLLDNADWLTSLGAIDFVRDVGKHFTVNAMLAKDSVRRRIEGEDGISFTEFSYSLLQAYDFLVLNERLGCVLQMGGSDQWGNITAGIELIRRARASRAFGLVLPLITASSGTKFGKSESGTIWLDAARTSPYVFYQFWLNVDDRDAGRYLRFFTFLDAARITDIERASEADPASRHAQRELAREVTRLVHGAAGLREAEAATASLFGRSATAMTADELLQVFAHVPSRDIVYDPAGWLVVDLVSSAGVTASKGEALRLVRGGGLYVNDRRISGEKDRLEPSDAIDGRLFVVRKGKKDTFLLRIADA